MAVRRVNLGDVEFYMGNSVGGYHTRLFVREAEAAAELAWLDGIWKLERRLWDTVANDRRESANAHMRHRVEAIMAATQRGLRRLGGPDLPRDYGFYRSERSGENPRILVLQEDEPVMGLPGETFDDISAEFASIKRTGFHRR